MTEMINQNNFYYDPIIGLVYKSPDEIKIRRRFSRRVEARNDNRKTNSKAKKQTNENSRTRPSRDNRVLHEL